MVLLADPFFGNIMGGHFCFESGEAFSFAACSKSLFEYLLEAPLRCELPLSRTFEVFFLPAYFFNVKTFFLGLVCVFYMFILFVPPT